RDVARVAHAVPGAEEPEPVLHDVAADVRAVVLARETLRRTAGRDDLFAIRLQRVGVVVRENVAGELVAAGLGDDVDDAAGGAAELRFVASGLDLHFLNELEVEVFALKSILDAGGVHAVDDVGV